MTSPDLIERLEKAEGGSLVLDGEIWCAVNGYEFIQWDGAGCVYRDAHGHISHEEARRVRPFSVSLDAALALAERVLPGWDWSVSGPKEPIWGYGEEVEGPPRATLRRRGEPVANEGLSIAHARTPALALCIAILRSRTGEGET